MYLIPQANMPLADQMARRSQAVVAGINELMKRKVIFDTKGAIDRDPEYRLDFIPAATRAGLTGWLSMPLAAAATAYSLLADNVPAAQTPTVPDNAVWVFYGVHVLTLNDPITQLYFGVGNNNIRKANFDIEKLYDQQTSSGYFTAPVVYGPQDIVVIQVLSRLATGAGCRVVLDSVVIEPNTVNQI
jgi:hypothetical protein